MPAKRCCVFSLCSHIGFLSSVRHIGWFGRNRSWDNGYGNRYSFTDQVAADVAADLVSAVIDIATDCDQ